MIRRLGIRWKLTLWYGGVLALVLVFFSVTVLVLMRQQLMHPIDHGLTEELSDVLFEVRRATESTTLHEWLDRRFAHHEGFDYQITRPDGGRFFYSQRMSDNILPVPDRLSEVPAFRSESIGSVGRWRVVAVQQRGPAGPLMIQVARSLAEFDHATAELMSTFLTVGPLTLLITIAGGYFLARRALAPVFKMTQTADQISVERLSQRIEVSNPDDELGALAGTLNRMIERLERSFAEMQRFTADAAHELRTPLAVMRNEAEVALRSARTSEEYGRVIENLLEETNQLTRLADQLLYLHRQDAGLQPVKRETVAINRLLDEVVGNMRLVAEAKGVEMTLDPPHACNLSADPAQLRRILYNLLDNAVKYTESGGKVTITAHPSNGHVTVTIRDTGVGIAAEHLPHIFDRFYRVDAARAGEAGAGLGLALCKALVKNLGGQVSLQSEPGSGTTVVLDLPTTTDGHQRA
jgi:heavy metal sensor kinase